MRPRLVNRRDLRVTGKLFWDDRRVRPSNNASTLVGKIPSSTDHADISHYPLYPEVALSAADLTAPGVVPTRQTNFSPRNSWTTKQGNSSDCICA